MHCSHFKINSRLFQISKYYYGDRIKPGTFELVDRSSGENITIKDDGYGNLYPVNNTISHSTNSPSSSDNYLGNILIGRSVTNKINKIIDLF